MGRKGEGRGGVGKVEWGGRWVSFPKTTEEINGPLTLSTADIMSAAQSRLICFQHEGPNVTKDRPFYINI